MTQEEKKQLKLVAKLAIERLDMDSISSENSELYLTLQDVPEFILFCNAGLHEALQEVEFTGIIDRDTGVTISIKQLHATITSAITIGMDLAVMMQRYGAKFPTPRQN